MIKKGKELVRKAEQAIRRLGRCSTTCYSGRLLLPGEFASPQTAMTHPFLCLPSGEHHVLVACSSAFTVVGVIVLWFADPGRLSGKGPRVVGFELAGTATKAKRIMDDWGEFGRMVAAFNLGLDYVFIPGYSTLMTLGCLWASQKHSGLVLIKLGILVAWLQWLAGALDCVEDASLLGMLFHGPSDLAAGIARISASGKFRFLLLGLGYIAISLL